MCVWMCVCVYLRSLPSPVTVRGSPQHCEVPVTSLSVWEYVTTRYWKRQKMMTCLLVRKLVAVAQTTIGGRAGVCTVAYDTSESLTCTLLGPAVLLDKSTMCACLCVLHTGSMPTSPSRGITGDMTRSQSGVSSVSDRTDTSLETVGVVTAQVSHGPDHQRH